MDKQAYLSIRELADAAGVSRRAIRFYIARGLLPPAQGRGRGGCYSREHLDRLQRIRELQRAGHSLDAIEQILAGGAEPPSPAPARPSRSTPSALTSLWTRIVLAPGLELHFDLGRHELTAEQILELRTAVQRAVSAWNEATPRGAKPHAGNGDTKVPENPS